MDGYRSKSELVTTQIRDLIISGDLRAGELLRQRHLADRFGVSPTPVREALHRLEAEGYVESRAHRGASVVRPPDARIHENQVIRMVLEALATEMAASRITSDEIEALRRLNARLAEVDESDPDRFELNKRFHFSLYEAAESPVLLSLLQQLWRTLQAGSRLSRKVSDAAKEHDQIITELEAGNGKQAAELVRQHISAGTPVAPENS